MRESRHTPGQVPLWVHRQFTVPVTHGVGKSDGVAQSGSLAEANPSHVYCRTSTGSPLTAVTTTFVSKYSPNPSALDVY